MDEKEIKELLLQENEEFRKLYQEHQKCEQELAELRARQFLPETERMKEKELKKKKLQLKDEMYRLIEEYRQRMRHDV